MFPLSFRQSYTFGNQEQSKNNPRLKIKQIKNETRQKARYSNKKSVLLTGRNYIKIVGVTEMGDSDLVCLLY